MTLTLVSHCRAETEAEAIRNRYSIEAQTYANISNALSLTPEGNYINVTTPSELYDKTRSRLFYVPFLHSLFL